MLRINMMMVFLCHLRKSISSILLAFLANSVIMVAQPVICSNRSGSNSFDVSREVEPDDGYNRLLSRYVLSCIRDGNIPLCDEDSLSVLFTRPSFRNVSVYLINPLNEKVANVLYPDSKMLWEDMSNQLLINCSNEDMIYSVTDSLLSLGFSNGIIALWNKCDVSRLMSYPLYKKCLRGEDREVGCLADLVIVNHNSGNEKEVRRLLRRINRLSPPTCKYLRVVVSELRTIHYYDYIFNQFEIVCQQMHGN